ncbi:MFS transporter [Streptomyces griseorubiginosus]|uniref:MFS transporter n=1 Tax=Streptomyces griseorubiginosus TaxID=67304 RepID=UPI001AD660ED|nr:MFS transporter [Streptomyces griseorubiginosus]MBO4253313.1 MFS transporter [Streptomyces griseorubiginosus]
MKSSTSPHAAAHSSGSGGWTPRLVLSLISLLCLTESAAFTNISTSTALPKIIDHFHTTQGGWLLTATLLVGAASAPLLGKLADLYGKRRMILASATAAGLGEILAATAPRFWVMIVGHVLLGTLTGLLFLCYSLIRDVYPKNLVPFAASVSVTGTGLLVVGAPFLIGGLIDHLGFRSLYVFNLGWLIVMGVIVVLTTPETSVRRPTRIDALGVLLVAGGVTLVLLPVSMGAQWGWGSARVVGLLIGGAVVLSVYVAVSLRIQEPVLNLRTLVRKTVLFGVLGGGLAFGLAAVVTTLLALLVMTPRQLGGTYGLGLSATRYALVTALFALGSVVGGIVVGVLTRRTGPRPLMHGGLVLLTAGLLALALAHDTLGKIIIGAVVFGLGLGFATGAMPNLVIMGTPASEQGSMSSAGGLSAGVIGATLTTVAFSIMTPTAKSPAPGVLVYGDSGISDSLLVFAALGFVTLLIGAVLLRSSGTEAAETPATAAAQESALPA